MSWENRGGLNYYYQATKSPEGKVVKTYLGSGESAAAAAAEVSYARAEREADRQAVVEEQARLAGPERLAAELVKGSQLTLEAVLIANGYHRKNYGPWRMKRDGKQERSR